MVALKEKAYLFPYDNEELIGVLHPTSSGSKTGVLVLVGGPQYRVGSHRQFLLLSRQLAEAGLPTFRFDVRGMGDSSGRPRNFEEIDEDIQAAINFFMQIDSNLDEVIIWGLCDAASAAICYALSDSRVGGVVMVNPWVRTEKGAANVHLKHYYRSRLFSRQFWTSMLRGKVKVGVSFKSFLSILSVSSATGGGTEHVGSLPEKVLNAVASFQGQILIVLSGNDLTAREFEDAFNTSPDRDKLVSSDTILVKRHKSADHTFSRSEWRTILEDWTISWVRHWNN